MRPGPIVESADGEYTRPLPAVATAATAHRVNQTGEGLVAAGQPGPMVVYIVDDDDDVRNGVARLLRSAGLVPRPYKHAESFLEEILDTPPGCILLDITMPRMSGPQVQARLNAHRVGLPVIAVSARDDDETRGWARALGARMFLRKPVDAQALLDAINWVTTSNFRD